MGGVDLVGGANSRGSYVSKILYVKIKESGPLGAGLRQCKGQIDSPGKSILPSKFDALAFKIYCTQTVVLFQWHFIKTVWETELKKFTQVVFILLNLFYFIFLKIRLIFFYIFVVTSRHFMEPLVLSALDFGWLLS